MKWISHGLIGVAVCAVFNPVAVPAALAGSTAPDWMENLFGMATGKRVKHRGYTHYLATWVAVCLFAQFVWDYNHLLFWFAAGGVLHWVADSITIAGVPVGWWSDRRVHLAGGRLRVGSGAEYVVVAGVVVVCAVFIWSRSGAGGFLPFFYHWGGYYEKGLIDGLEWRTHRFDFV